MKHFFALFLFVLMLAGCESETTGIDNRLRGTLHGRVELLEPGPGVLIAPSSAGIKVTLEGTTFSAFTNDSGDWELKDIPAGTYTIVFEKDGYGMQKIFSHEFVGGGVAYLYYGNSILLRKIATFHAELFYAAMKDTLDPEYPNLPPSERIIIKATVPDATGEYYMRIAHFFFSKSENVTNDPNTYDYVSADRKLWYFYNDGGTVVACPIKDSIISVSLPKGYTKSGETIYVVAYAAPYTGISGGYGPGDYYDPTIRKQYFTSVSPHRSQVLSFVVP